MTTLLNRYSSERAKFRKVARELSEAPPRVRVADGGAEERGDREDELLQVQGQTDHEKFIRNVCINWTQHNLFIIPTQ